MPGVILYIPDLQTGTVSDEKGNYKLNNLPVTKVLLQISFVGYRTVIETVDLETVSLKNFEMEYAATEMNEVVVTGMSKAGEQKRTPISIVVVSKLALLQNSSTNIIDALANQPGISQVTTGTGISKPVIRGLGYNRVVVINDGIRQEGQQWGDEHGIEIDEFSVNKVEILKGPASLAYGSDAMAGVINMISAPTLPEAKTAGNISLNFQTNNGLFGYSANLAGNKKGLVYDMRYSNKLAHTYRNKNDGYVLNSGFRENALSGLIGMNKSWGYSHLIISKYNFTPGIVEGERDSITGKFIKPIDLNGIESWRIASSGDFRSYTPATPYQKIHHYKAAMNSSIIVGKGNIKTTLGFQQNRRQEYADILNPDTYGLYFLLNTLNYDVRYNFPDRNNFNISSGINGMLQGSENRGTEFLVPEFDLFDIGVFTILRKSLGRFDLSGGLRYDKRTEHGKNLYVSSDGTRIETPEPGSTRKFADFKTSFSGISGSIGATWQISETLFTKLNFSRGYRAPNIGELGSNGVHDGTVRYIIGDPGLKAENSLQFDYALGLNTEHISAELVVFDNAIDNFIFSRKLSSISGGDSITNEYNTFKFVAGKAHLLGSEIRVDIHPHPYDWLHFENTFSYVQAVQHDQPDSLKYLPFTPAPKLQTALKVDFKKITKLIHSAYIKFDMDNYFVQNKYYAAFGTETRSPGYTLLNLGLGGEFVFKNKSLFSLYISANNITDVTYQSHLSRLKYAPENYASGRTGVYNMGRNISFKMIVPIDIN